MQVFAYLDDLEPGDVRVELYADDGSGKGDASVIEMTVVEQLVGSTNGFRFEAKLPADHHPANYTGRVVPSSDLAQIPLESSAIAWLDS